MLAPRIIHQFRETFYFCFPYKRDQDVIRLSKRRGKTQLVASVVDGWHNTDYFPGNKEGRRAAVFIARTFPDAFLSSLEADIPMRAQLVAQKINTQFLLRFPKHISSVGTFVFCSGDRTIIATIGTIATLVMRKKTWERPKEFHDNELDWKKNESGSATFFGRGELAGNPLYSCTMEVAVYPPATPILVLTDGAQKMLSISRINSLFKRNSFSQGKDFMNDIHAQIMMNRHQQRDDASVLMITPA